MLISLNPKIEYELRIYYEYYEFFVFIPFVIFGTYSLIRTHTMLKPLSNRVVVEPVKEETKGGIILPETAGKDKPEKGKIIACGPGKLMENGTRAAMEVKVGDVVMFKKYSPDEVKIDGKEYLVLEESDIMGIIQ